MQYVSRAIGRRFQQLLLCIKEIWTVVYLFRRLQQCDLFSGLSCYVFYDYDFDICSELLFIGSATAIVRSV